MLPRPASQTACPWAGPTYLAVRRNRLYPSQGAGDATVWQQAGVGDPTLAARGGDSALWAFQPAVVILSHGASGHTHDLFTSQRLGGAQRRGIRWPAQRDVATTQFGLEDVHAGGELGAS